MKHLTILFASSALLIACQSNDGPVTPDPDPAPAEKEPVIEKASTLQPVAAVSGKSVQTDMNFSKEMQGAKPGEVRGFINPDGDTAYTMLSDGKITFQQFAEHVFNKKEGMSLTEPELHQVAITLAKQNRMAPDPDKAMPPNKSVVCELKYFTAMLKSKQAASTTTKPPQSATDAGMTTTADGKTVDKTVTGRTGPAASGLDID